MKIKQRNFRLPFRLGLSRRDFIRLGGMSAAATLLTACGVQRSDPRSPSSMSMVEFTPDLEVALTAKSSEASLLPGPATQVLHYESELLLGNAEALQSLDNYLGPIIRVKRGEKVRIHFHNEIDEESIIHWHGLVIPEAMDGHPRFAIGAGETYTYEFEVTNRAGTYWFHPHPHGKTGAQVYRGLAGFFIVSDEEEETLNLPTGEYDIPLVIQDRQFDAENQFVYAAAEEDSEAHSGMMGGMMNHGNMNSMMAQMMGQRGDHILINGQVDASLAVATRAYRLRLLNGSNSRIYKLGWSDGVPLTVIGTDGGLLEQPQKKPYVMLAPGERVELWVDFSEYDVGTKLQLRSLEFAGMEMGSMMAEMAQEALPSGSLFPVLTVRVEREEEETLTLPEQLVTIERLLPDEAVNADAPYEVALFMDNMRWTLNGRTFTMDEVASNEQMQLDTLSLWQFTNRPGRGMMADFMAHPMHIHGVQFQVVDRMVDPQYRVGWQTVADGYIDKGWKDTVLVMPGEQVKVLMKFTEPGLFVYHCHILEHEDMGMMRNFEVA